MEELEKEDITSELAEIILDKIHLAMTKENPSWQEMAMSDGPDSHEEELNSLLKEGFLKVLKHSSKTLSEGACIQLSKEFKTLKASYLSNYLKEKSKAVQTPEQKEEIQKSKLLPGQKRQGNYKKTYLQGIEIRIENKKGTYREGTDSHGKKWRNKIHNDYGYIKKTDGDHVDVFVGPDKESRVVFVINQKDKEGNFDEHKVMLGFHDEKSARNGYIKNYPKNWKGFGSIVKLTVGEFKEWLKTENTKKELKNPKIEFLKSKLSHLRSTLKNINTPQNKLFQKEEYGEMEEESVYKSLLLEVKKSTHLISNLQKADVGRPPDLIGTEEEWNDGRMHKKTESGWITLPKKREKRTPEETKIKKHPKKKIEEKPKKGNTHPTKLPFSQIRVIEQYTAKKDYDRNQIETLKIKIKKNGYDPSFPLSVDLKEGKWTVVAGHHRYEAVRELIEEGHLSQNIEIPVVEKNFASKNDRLVAQISENHRRNVLATDEAKAYGEMVKNGWDVKKISEELGIKVGEVNKRLALNNLSPELFALVHKKDRSLPLGIAEVIGMNAKDANDKPSHTMQIRAFKWYAENRSKYGSRGASVLQNYIKELQSGELENFDFDYVATDIQKEALKNVSKEKASANKKMLEVMLDGLTKSIQRPLGDNITSLNPQVVKELAASLALSADKGVESSSVLGRLGVIIQDLTLIKNSIQSKLKEIENESSTPLLFAKGFLQKIKKTLELSKGKKVEI
ncbi:ParB N-terminal domain-containing protein [Leptospira alstonii]|uniref:ParB-like protein n=1 Tax=Leptospira alstonii serovar Sichuan str. 79601 TaxID=1218565 RepID=M6CY07_9LEPT|nr:ParB N-terminal domain-containing protein [Leptospira alstonii]AGS80532.1 ParB-like protein [Leptospira phage vB_LalZ_80412-LE1]EMJ95376.1 ParB-like protein [Leptospira alstonii serovar Sichuan str. 79601]